MRRFLTTLGILSAVYLALGAMFALANQPQQMWGCADPSAPHGEMFYSDPPRDGCRPTVSVGERVVSFVGLTLLWLPLVTLKGLANAMS